MTAQDYIESKLENLKVPIKYASTSGNIEDAIYAKLMSKKFRKLKAGEPCINIVKTAVARAVEAKKPITISMCFGGNKLWRLEEAPEVEWGELLSLIYYLEFAKTVASVHEPGVILDYFSQDISVESLDNLSREELDKYTESFKDLIKFVESFLPKGISITYRRHRDFFADDAEYYKELNEAKHKILDKNSGNLPVMTAEMKTRTELNVRLLPEQDKKPDWQQRVELQHQAIFETPTLMKYFNDPDMIFICPTYYDDSIVTGSTKHSIAKFWAGVGALQVNKGSFNDLILTPKQLSVASFDWENIAIHGLEAKNFKKIRVLG